MCQRRQKVLEALRHVGAVEVLRKAKAEQQGQPDGDVGVTGEVGIDLDRVAVDGDEGVEREEALG